MPKLKDIALGIVVAPILIPIMLICNGPRIVTTSLDDLSLKRGFKYGNT